MTVLSKFTLATMVSPPHIRCWTTGFCGDFRRKGENTPEIKLEIQFLSRLRCLPSCGSSLSIEQDLWWKIIFCWWPCLLPALVAPWLLFKPSRTSGAISMRWRLGLKAGSECSPWPHPHGHPSLVTPMGTQLRGLEVGGMWQNHRCREHVGSNCFPALCQCKAVA